jgi:hypothetical protein
MILRGRYYGCERKGFPPVTNYDFSTNTPVRGVGNLEFKWEEVTTDSVYFLREATADGSFESNTYVADYGIDYPTGLNLITDNSLDDAAYPNWILTGSHTIYIGISGILILSGTLPGVNNNFYAHPIAGNEAIGLYATGNINYPAVYSALISTGSESGIVHDDMHQAYLQCRLNYGTEGRLRTYIRGYVSGSPSIYYNPYTTGWSYTIPTGYHSITGTSYNEIIFDFTPTGFTGSVPTQYDIYVQSINPGTFITIDDIHIDTYLYENAFLDYLVPTGYVLQFTPDLGWHNIFDMFDNSRLDLYNPHLVTLGPYTIDNGGLVDNLDDSVSAIISSNDIEQITTESFKKYLWRALPVSPNGQITIENNNRSYPQRFEFISKVESNRFSVTELVKQPDSNTYVILGTRDKNTTVLVDDLENNPNIEYVSDFLWKYTTKVVSISRTIKFQAKDTNGALSSFILVNIEDNSSDQSYLPLWNIFDNHGITLDIDRNKEESNYDYSLRMKDYFSNKPGSSFQGIVNGASRELGINKIPEAITLGISKYNGIPIVSSAIIQVTAYSVKLHTRDMVISETILVDSVYNTISLSKSPYELPTQVTVNGKQIPISLIQEDSIFNDSVIEFKFKIDSDEYAGQLCEITYPYYEEIFFKNHQNLFSLKTEIDKVRTSSGNKIFDAVISSRLSGNESCLGLFIHNVTITPSITTSISWSPIYLKRISDRGFRDYYLTGTDDLKETEYYSFVKEMKDSLKLFWGSVEADRSVWDPADSSSLSMDSIPTLFDPKLSVYMSLLNGTDKRIESTNMWARNNVGYSGEFVNNNGLRHYLFQPGVANDLDLAPQITSSFSYNKTDSYIQYNIGPTKNQNNTTIYFSGQV